MNLIECLQEVSDYRRKQGQRYSNAAMLLIIIMAILRGHYAYREIARFCKLNESLFVSKFGFKNGRVPSHVTISAFIRNTDFSSIQAAFFKWACHSVHIEEGEWIAIDGKSILVPLKIFFYCHCEQSEANNKNNKHFQVELVYQIYG